MVSRIDDSVLPNIPNSHVYPTNVMQMHRTGRPYIGHLVRIFQRQLLGWGIIILKAV